MKSPKQLIFFKIMLSKLSLITSLYCRNSSMSHQSCPWHCLASKATRAMATFMLPGPEVSHYFYVSNSPTKSMFLLISNGSSLMPVSWSSMLPAWSLRHACHTAESYSSSKNQQKCSFLTLSFPRLQSERNLTLPHLYHLCLLTPCKNTASDYILSFSMYDIN